MFALGWDLTHLTGRCRGQRHRGRIQLRCGCGRCEVSKHIMGYHIVVGPLHIIPTFFENGNMFFWTKQEYYKWDSIGRFISKVVVLQCILFKLCLHWGICKYGFILHTGRTWDWVEPWRLWSQTSTKDSGKMQERAVEHCKRSKLHQTTWGSLCCCCCCCCCFLCFISNLFVKP